MGPVFPIKGWRPQGSDIEAEKVCTLKTGDDTWMIHEAICLYYGERGDRDELEQAL